MIPIQAVVSSIIAKPAPVILLDTCTLLDLFRRDGARAQPRVPVAEIRSAVGLLELLTERPEAAHLVVPELIPIEFRDHADQIAQDFDKWLGAQDDNQSWLADAARWVGTTLPAPLAVRPLALHGALRGVADGLLALAAVLARDQACLDRAVVRLISKRRPSHKKEMKDSMNLEQCLELSSQLQGSGFTFPRVFVSSNTNDFAETATSPRLHPDLQPEFALASLDYATSFRAALGPLRANGLLP